MGKKAGVYQNGRLAGILEKKANDRYIFEYDVAYFHDRSKEPVSLTLPKSKRVHMSDRLFSYFYGLLAEGNLKALQCRQHKIDENDHFTRLIKTAHTDVIGCTTVKEIPE
ncbi:MAG: HipA N-terminal domain-containing protein [SAR324 cluster bacterium]|nr:HipA N-terminal domain-containing protein [SAR324 cluster bacterium]